MTKRLGKIQRISFGMGGYDDAMLGVTVILGSDKDGWGVQDFKGTWTTRPEMARWTTEDQSKHFADLVRWVGDLLAKAKVNDLTKLKDIPIETTFDSGLLVEWRVLTEVL